jgi:hypothetical protein
MYLINKVVSLPYNPFRKLPVEMDILKLVEGVTPFPVAYVDKVELPAKNGRRRFLIKAAYGNRDK